MSEQRHITGKREHRGEVNFRDNERVRRVNPSDRERMRRARLRKAHRRRLIILRRIILTCLCSIILGIGFFSYTMLYATVYKEKTIEAGTKVTVEQFVKHGLGHAAFASDSEVIDTKQLGTYNVKVKKGMFTHNCVVTVEDTVKPTAIGTEQKVSMIQELDPKDFVKDVVDATELSYRFITPVNMELFEPQRINICVEDEGGNAVEVTSTITVSDDVEPPQIKLENPADVIYTGTGDLDGVELQGFRSILGEGISYKKQITVIDNSGEEIKLQIDNSQVDIDTVGQYPIICTAVDSVGNEAKVNFIVDVYKLLSSEEKVIALAQEVLAEIVTDTMTDEEKAEKIFYWCREHIAYSEYDNYTDWTQGAYDGLEKRAGDCFVYAATSKVLLTEAGIQNKDIAKIPSDTKHFWNLVNFGDGWRHFDTTRRYDGTIIYLWSDAKLMEYSKKNKDSHHYDPTAYPEIL